VPLDSDILALQVHLAAMMVLLMVGNLKLQGCSNLQLQKKIIWLEN